MGQKKSPRRQKYCVICQSCNGFFGNSGNMVMEHVEVTTGSKIPTKQLKRVLLSFTPWNFTPYGHFTMAHDIFPELPEKSNACRINYTYFVSVTEDFPLRHQPDNLFDISYQYKSSASFTNKFGRKNIAQNGVIGQ